MSASLAKPIDFGTIFELQDGASGQTYGVTLATLLQCLCVAEQRYMVPPFEPEWAAESLPDLLRERALIR